MGLQILKGRPPSEYSFPVVLAEWVTAHTTSAVVRLLFFYSIQSFVSAFPPAKER